MTPDPTFEPGPIARSAAVSVALLAPVARFSLRARAADLPALSHALGLDLPRKIGDRAGAGTTEVLCLGPDDWHILAAEADAAGLAAAAAAIRDATPHSLTDISDREVTVAIEGPGAAELLTLGCPRDIDRIQPGRGCRTIMDGVTVLLRRDAADRFRLDMWRSFAPHVIALLRTGCAELAADS